MHSITFFAFVFTIFLRHTPFHTVMLIKRAPKQPHTIPRIIAAGKSRIEFYPICVTSPNLSAAPSDIDNGLPMANEYKMENTNTAVDVAINIFQSIVKVQNVFGFEIS